MKFTTYPGMKTSEMGQSKKAKVPMLTTDLANRKGITLFPRSVSLVLSLPSEGKNICSTNILTYVGMMTVCREVH